MMETPQNKPATDPTQTDGTPAPPKRPATGRRKKPLRWIALLLTLGVIAAGAYGLYIYSNGNEVNDVLTTPVEKGPLTISVVVEGSVSNRDQVVVKSEVEGRTSILSLVPEGTRVKAGDVLIELDPSELQERLTQQQITVLNAESAYVQKRENLEVVKSQADSDVAEAELQYRFAQQDLQKYLEGEYPQAVQQAEADITIAREELQRAEDDLAWSTRLAEEGYITRTELQADELAQKRSELDLELAQRNLEVLKTYTHKRDLAQKQSDVEQAKRALERVKRRTRADIVQAEAELRAKDSEFQRQKTQLEKFEDQLAKCTITAPVDGLVVYATSGKARRGRSVDPLEEGTEVREREELIYLPTSQSMKVDLKVPEASVRKISVGMPARITADTLKSRSFQGVVGRIGIVPDAPSWSNGWRTVYSTDVYITDDAEGLIAGTTCQAEIIAEQYDEALYIPVQSVVRVEGQPFVQVLDEQTVMPRPIQVGMDNNRVIRVVSGLRAGERVLLNPSLAGSSPALESPPQDPQQPAVEIQTRAGEAEKESTSPTPAANQAPKTSARNTKASSRPGRPSQG